MATQLQYLYTRDRDIIGAKTWDDNNNQDGARPASITIRLLANGTEVIPKRSQPQINGSGAYRQT